MKKHHVTSILIVLAMLGLVAALIVSLFPIVREVMAHTDNEGVMVQYIESYGPGGVPILIGLQALQIIVGFIPAGGIQILTGLCYGVWMGVLINVIGCVLGNTLVIVVMRQLKDLVSLLPKRKKPHKGIMAAISPERLSRIKNPERIAFFFFLIPAIPNGVVPYVFAETTVSLPRYLAAVVAGTIPSTLAFTLLGERLAVGSYLAAIIIAAVLAVLVVLVLVFRKRIVEMITRP